MKALSTLVDEHRLIVKELDLLTTAAERIVRNQNPPREFFEKAVKFTRKFTNEYHHYKEEIVMFGLLAQKHDGEIDAEIERLRNQHGALHDYMHAISQALDAYERGSDDAARRLHRNLSEYIGTLRGHINAENQIFYPLVAQSLDDDEQAELDKLFDEYSAKAGPNAMDEYADMIEEMGALV